MGLEVKNNRDGKSHTLRFVILVVVYIKEGRNGRVGGACVWGKKCFILDFL
jgi:hypothetical protein